VRFSQLFSTGRLTYACVKRNVSFMVLLHGLGPEMETREMVPTAYDNDPAFKDRMVAQMRAHAAADEIIKGQYWQQGKGCLVGCAIHGDDHSQFDDIIGPGGHMLAQLADAIFEGATNARAMRFPVEFFEAIRPGADLSRVQWQFLHWLLTTPAVNPGITHPIARDAVAQCAAVVSALADGRHIDVGAAWIAESAARSAARSARSAAWSAAESAESAEIAEIAAESAWSAARSAAWSAAESAESAEIAEIAAESAWSAARSAAWSAAESARSAAWSAAWSAAESAAWSAAESARSAARSARSAESAVRSAAYDMMADKLVELLRAA
jgi:hypothetical protein